MAKRTRARTDQEVFETEARRLVDQGRLIESGWVGLRALWVPAEAPVKQVQDLRMAFMAGASYLFASIMAVMDSDADPTDKDMERIEAIAKELKQFEEDLKFSTRRKW